MSQVVPDRASIQLQDRSPGSAATGGVPGLPAALQRYVAAVSIVGPLLAILVAIANIEGITFESLGIGGL